MRRLALLAAIGAAGLLLPAAALSQYVVYFQAFGEWAVACWTDAGAPRPACSLSTPPPDMAAKLPAAHAVLSVVEGAPGAFTLVATVRGPSARGGEIALAVDGGAPDRATLDADFRAAWQGEAAARIVERMLAGRRAVLSWQGYAEGAVHEQAISLARFAEALSALRENLRARGALSLPAPT